MPKNAPAKARFSSTTRDISSHLSAKQIPFFRRKIGVVFQDFKLLEHKTVGENVAFAMEVSGLKMREINKSVPKILEMVGLLDKEKAFPRQLSGGEVQRVAIARALVRQLQAADRRRTDRQPRPDQRLGNHPAAAQDQPVRHDRTACYPQQGNRRRAAQAGGDDRGRNGSARRRRSASTPSKKEGAK
ncbi:MAG: ATP-binding cassette domain-containing protein [Hymenobacter sp.]